MSNHRRSAALAASAARAASASLDTSAAARAAPASRAASATQKLRGGSRWVRAGVGVVAGRTGTEQSSARDSRGLW